MSELSIGADYMPRHYVLVTARGDLGAGTSPLLAETFAEIRSERRPVVAVDLSAARVHGRHGLAPLIGALKSCRDRGGDLYLIGASPMVRRVVGYDTRGPVKCFASRGELDREVFGDA